MKTLPLTILAFQLISVSASSENRAARHALDFDWMRDPHILRHGGSYYLTPTRLEHIDLGVPGVEIWKSDDLETWQHLGVPWDTDYSSWLKPDGAGAPPHVVAPELYFLDGRWIVVHGTSDKLTNLLSGTGEYNEGFHEPFAAKLGDRPHPSIFTDGDRTRYLLHSPATVQKLDPTLHALDGKPRPLLPPDHPLAGSYKPCTLRHINNRYVLFVSAWSTGTPQQGTHNLYCLTSEKLTGPYTTKPRLAARFAGGGTPFQDRDGRWWTSATGDGQLQPNPAEGQKLALNDLPWTINPQGLTLVPLDITTTPGGDLHIQSPLDLYNTPGPEESIAPKTKP